MRILLVEDNLDLGDTVESKLRLAGHSVQWARDGLTALRRGLDETWDALVLDINLPGKDGFSVIRELRAAGLEAPVLVMTARAEIEDKIDMLDLGADDYLVKPFDLRELEARLRALMRRPPARPAASRPTATWAWIWPPGRQRGRRTGGTGPARIPPAGDPAGQIRPDRGQGTPDEPALRPGRLARSMRWNC